MAGTLIERFARRDQSTEWAGGRLAGMSAASPEAEDLQERLFERTTRTDRKGYLKS